MSLIPNDFRLRIAINILVFTISALVVIYVVAHWPQGYLFKSWPSK